MSWARDEWKQELPANALKNVYELEQRCETLQKDNKLKQFQFESLQAALDKQKKLTEEEKSNHLALKKEISSWTESCRELEQNREKTLHDLNAKEAHVRCLDGKLSRCQHNLETETAKGMQLKSDLEHLQYDHNQIITKFEKQSADFSKAKEANGLLQRQLSGHKERVRCLENQLKSLGAEPNSRAKKSSSSSEPESDWFSDLEIKLKETQASLQLEREYRQKIEDNLKALQPIEQEALPATSDGISTTSETDSPFENFEFAEFKKNAEATKANLELQLKAQCKELVSLTEALQGKDVELQHKIKDLNDMATILQKKELEITDVKQNLLKSSNTNNKLSEELLTTKSHLDKAIADFTDLERRAKQRDQEVECQRHNSETIIKGMEEKLKGKEREHRQELHSQSQMIMALERQYHDLERKTSDLQHKVNNSQQLVESKDHEIVKLKESLSEMEKNRRQQACDIDIRIVEFQQKAKEEHQKCVEIKQQLECMKASLIDKDNKLGELNSIVEQCHHNIRAKQQEVDEKEKMIGESQSAIKLELVSALEKYSLLLKEKDASELEHERVLQDKVTECTGMLTELGQQKQELIQLKERNVNFETLLMAKEVERQKFEEMNTALGEKLQKMEKDLEISQEEWTRERGMFQDKEKSLQTVIEAMKNDLKALQHDYKKACELADLKSAENREVIDKLEASQKHAHELHQRMSRAEAALKERENALHVITLKNDELLKQQKQKVEEFERRLEELTQMCSDKNTEIDRLKGMADSLRMQLNKAINECMEKDKEGEKLSAKLSSAESHSEEVQNSLRDVEEKLENSKRLINGQKAQAEELITEIASKEKVLCQLQQKQLEYQAKLGEAEEKNTFHQLQKEEDLGILRSKDEEISSLRKEIEEIQAITDKRAEEMKEQYTARQNELEFLQVKLVYLETVIEDKNMEINRANVQLQNHTDRVVELETRLLSKEEIARTSEEEIVDLRKKLEQSSVILEDKKEEINDLCEKLSRLQTERESSEDYQSKLQQLISEHADLEEKLRAAHTIAESKAEELSATLIQLTSAEEERTELTSMLDELCNTNAVLEEKITERTRMVEQVSEALKNKDEKLSLQKNTIEELQSVSERQAAELEERCSSLDSKIVLLQEKCDHLEVYSQTKNKEVTSATEKIREMYSEISKLQDEVASKVEIIECRGKEREILNEKLQHQTNALDNKERELKEMINNFHEMETNKQTLHENMFTELEELRKEVTILTGKLDQNAVAMEMKDQDIASMTEQLLLAENERTVLGAKCEELTRQNEIVERKHTEMANNMQQLSEVLKGKEKELVDKRKGMEELESETVQKICDIKEQCHSQELQVTSLQQRCCQLESLLQSKEVEQNSSVVKLQEVNDELCKLRETLAETEELANKDKKEKDSLLCKLEHNFTALCNKEKQLNELSVLLEEERGKQRILSEMKCSETETLKEELCSLTEKFEKLSVVVDVKNQEIASLIQQLRSSEEEKAGLNGNIEDLNSVGVSLQEKNTDLESKIGQISDALRANQDLLAMKSQLLEDLQTGGYKEISELKEESAVREKQILSLNEKCALLEICVERKENELVSCITELKNVKDSVQTLHEVLETNKQDAMTMELNNSELAGKLHQASAVIESMKQEHENASKVSNELLNDKDLEIERQAELAESLRKEVRSLTERLENLGAASEVNDNNLTAMLQEIKSAEVEKANLENKLDELSLLQANLQQSLTETVSKNHQLIELLRTKDDELSAGKHSIENMNKELECYREKTGKEVSELQENNALLLTYSEQHKSLLQSREEESTRIKKEIEVFKKECDDLRTELSDKTVLLLETQERLSVVLSDKEGQSSLLEAKEKDLLSVRQVQKDNVKEKEKLAEELLAATEQISAQGATILCLSEEKTRFISTIEKLQSEIQQIREAKCSLGKKAEEGAMKLEEQLAWYEDQLKKKESSEQDLINKLSHQDKMIEETNKLLEKHREEIAQLSTQKEMLQMDYDDKDSYIESLDKKLEQLETAVEELKQKVKEKQDLNESLSKQLDSVTQQLTETLSNEKEKDSSIIEFKDNVTTLKAQLSKETEKNGKLSADVQELKAKLDHMFVSCENKVTEVEVLTETQTANEAKISRLCKELDEREKKLNYLESEKTVVEEELKNTVRKYEEESALIEKEKECTLLESRKLLRDKTEECVMALEKVALSEKEEARLKDLVVSLENISASKDQEKEKLELSFEALIEKKQKREEELMRHCEVLEEEKGLLREKTQELQASMKTLRHESNVLQQDYKKACELADLKSLDYRDIVDKLDDSQKHLQETRVKLSRAETELKQTAEEVLQGRRENQELLHKITRTKEEFEENRERLRDEIKSGQENISELSSQLRNREAAIRTLETEKSEVEQMLKRIKEELWESKEELHSCTSQMVDKEILLKRQEEDNNTIRLLQEQVQELETCRSELVSELENAKEEMCRLRDKAHSEEAENTSVTAAKESELEAQNSKISELEVLNTETLEKLQKAIECGEVKDKEAKEKISDLLSQNMVLSSALDENVTLVDQLRDKNTQLEDANREVKRAKKCLENALAGQEKEMDALLDKNRRLEDDLSGAEMQLDVVRKQAEENKEQIEKVQGQSQREIEKLQNELSARCSQVEKLQRNLNEQSDKQKSLNDHMSCLTRELESVKKEHEGCVQKEQSSNSLQEQVLELEHQLARQQSNTDAMMQAFREQEEQWEKEKIKILSSFKNSGSENCTQNSSAISAENEQLKRKLEEMQNNLEIKAREHSETLRLIEKRASSTSVLEAELHSRIKKLELECDELKYNLKQKDEDIFVKEELLKQKEQAVKSLESKYAAAEEVERELRHHLGEVTQQLEWSKDSNATVPENNDNNTAHEDITKELAVLKAERKDRDKEIEEERVRIVEAAKGFAMEQEEKFVKKIGKLEQKLCRKDEELHEMDSELKQLRHNLQTLQQEKNVLLEAEEEREQEFDAERERWSSGDFTNEKVQQCIEDLEEERKRVTVLQENCSELQEKLHHRENCNLLLQKKLDELQNEQKLDSKERETREDDLYSTVDSLRSKSEKLQEEVQNEKSVTAGLANEKAELLAKLETLEKQLKESIRFASDLQQECDVLKEKLEGLKKDNDRLLKENDATLVSKSQDKLNFEDANRKLQELREELEKEGKEKTKLSETVAKLEKKCKDLEEMLKQADEKMVEMSEDHQVELDSVRFTLYSAKDECIALQEENEDLKQRLTGGTEQQRWNNEKKRLLQELEEIKMRYEKASKDREDLEGEVHKLNIKVMSLEENSTSSKDAVAEIESLKTKVKTHSEELEKEKNRADEKEKEANELLESTFQLVKKQKKLVREKESLESRFKIACEKLNSMKATKSKEGAIQQDGHCSNCSKQTSTASEVSLPKATSSTVSNPAVLLSPLARSLSNLEIKSIETATSVTQPETTATSDTSQITRQSSSVTTPPQETESSKVMTRDRVVNSSNLPQPRKRQSLATGNVLLKPSQLAENVDSKKRLNQQDAKTNPTKRCRITIGGDSVEMPDAQQPPDGLPEVVSKGFADIPPPPIKSPFILRRSTASALSSGVRTRNQLKQGARRSALPAATNTKVTSFPKENPLSAGSPPRGQTVPPEMPLSRRKTNQSNIALGPRTKIPKPGTQVARAGRPSASSGSSRGQPTARGRAVPRLMTGPGPSNTANNDKECKMQ